ncbi:MAG: tetratricopeptide repeat protein [Anaerolineae bacterium]|nr:tetratricopeptide repeat protein [Anaerolineae bacterium]
MNSSDENSRGLARYFPQIALVVVGLLVIALVLLSNAGSLNLGTGLLILAMAGYFPLSYVAYEAFQSESRITRLERDFRLLGISSQDPTEKKEDSKQLAQKLYKRTYNPWNYALHITLIVLLTIVGMLLFIWNPGGGSADTAQSDTGAVQDAPDSMDDFPVDININTLQAIRVGFLGAYLFAAQLVYRRYTTSDLQPTVYLNGALTLVAGMVFNYVAFEAIVYLAETPPQDPVTGVGAGLLSILAFSLGYFPNLALNWFSQVAYSTLGVSRRRADALPLSLIDGISQWHEARLRDIGIDNVQNLASYDIRELLLNTTFSGHQVIDWIDQALFYLYVEERRVERFREASIRTISDFREMWQNSDDAVKKDIATQLQITDVQLKILYDMTNVGPNLAYVLDYWENVKKIALEETKYYVESEQRRLKQEFDNWLDRAADASPEEMAEMQEQVKSVRQELAAAEPGAKGAAAVQPTSPRRWVGLGNLHRQEGNLAQAIECYKKAIELDADYALAYSRLGQAYLAQGRHNLAGESFERAVELDANAKTLNDRGAYYLATNQIDKARADLEQAAASGAEEPALYVNLGRIYEIDGDTQRAIASYKKAIELDRNAPEAYNNLAWLYAGVLNENLDEALQLAEKAVELSRVADGKPRSDFLHTLGVVQWKRSDLKTARDTLVRAKDSTEPGSAAAQEIERDLAEVEKALPDQEITVPKPPKEPTGEGAG